MEKVLKHLLNNNAQVLIISAFQFYEEMFLKVFEIALQDLVDDNIQRVEFKHTIGCLYDDNGSITIEDECLKIQECIRSFNEKRQQQNLSTIQVALINAFPKFFSLEVIKTKMEETIKLRSQFPDLILGFDLVAEEETSTQNIAFAEAFMEIPSLEQKYGVDLPLYLHCGETVDQYLETVYDVLALSNVRRIGHGLAFVKHPYLVQNEIIPRNIVVEACPISNQILGYVKDLRAHPALNLLNMGVKVTINPDDPSCFKCQGVTFDYLSVLLAWQLDLGGLKTLVFNTLDFIEVKSNEKEVLVANVKKSWDLWITQLLSS